MKRWLALCCLFVHPALSQVEHGSVGIVYVADDKLVLAADSRVTEGDLGTIGAIVQRDNECKIAALGGKVFFVSVGAMGFHRFAPPILSWTNLDIVHASYDRVVSKNLTSDGHILDIANDFAETVRSNWAQAAIYEPTSVIRDVSDTGLTLALIAGRDLGGNFQIIQVVITFELLKLSQVGIDVDFVLACPLRNFCPIGEVAVPLEFLSGLTERSKAEARAWMPPIGTSPENLGLERAIRVVELAALYTAKKDVGGPVDALELTRIGDIRWYRRKANCPDN